MKKGLLKLLLPILLVALCFGGAPACALAAGGTSVEGQDAEIKGTFSETIYGGLAINASNRPKIGLFSVSRSRFPGSYGAQLTGQALDVYEKMVDYYAVDGCTGDLQFRTEISYSDLTVEKDALNDAVTAAYGAFLYDRPELFWIGKQMTYSFSYTETKIIRITIKFGEETFPGAKQYIAAFNSAVDSAENVIRSRRKSAAPYDTLKAIHDYVCENITYPNPYPNVILAYHSAAGMFLDVTGKKGVCECYAKSFAILCRRFNIPAILVVGDADGAHMWNYVQLDGKWYAVDTTWDDSRGAGPEDTYFLIGSNTSIPEKGTFGSSREIYTQFLEDSNGNHLGHIYTIPDLNPDRYSVSTGTASIVEHVCETLRSTAPTCTAAGVEVLSCSSCDDIRRVVTAALGHDFSGQGVYNSDGTRTFTCTRCGATKTETVASPAPVAPIATPSETPAPAPAPAPAAPAAAAASPAASTASTGLTPSSIKSLVLQGSQSTSVLKVGKTVAGDPIKRIESLNKKLVKVTSKGKIKALKKSGSAKLRITLESGSTLTVKVKLQSGTVKTKKITGVPKTLTLSSGATAKLSPTLSPLTSQQKLSYSTSDKKVVTVTSSGRLKAKKKGKAVISVKSGSKTVKCTVTVN